MIKMHMIWNAHRYHVMIPIYDITITLLNVNWYLRKSSLLGGSNAGHFNHSVNSAVRFCEISSTILNDVVCSTNVARNIQQATTFHRKHV